MAPKSKSRVDEYVMDISDVNEALYDNALDFGEPLYIEEIDNIVEEPEYAKPKKPAVKK